MEPVAELRAPLDSMVVYLDLLLEEEMTEQERRRFLEVIRSSAVRLRGMVTDEEASSR